MGPSSLIVPHWEEEEGQGGVKVLGKKGGHGRGREGSHLEVGDGVCGGEPGGARVLLGAEGPVEGAGDGAQVEGAHRRRRDAVALEGDGDQRDVRDGDIPRTRTRRTVM